MWLLYFYYNFFKDYLDQMCDLYSRYTFIRLHDTGSCTPGECSTVSAQWFDQNEVDHGGRSLVCVDFLFVLMFNPCLISSRAGVPRFLGPGREPQPQMAASTSAWARATHPPGGDHRAASQAAQQPGTSLERGSCARRQHARYTHHWHGWGAGACDHS